MKVSTPQPPISLQVLANGWVWLGAIGIFLTNVAISGMGPTFEIHIRSIPGLRFSSSQIGALFLVGAGSYTLSGPVVGHFADRHVGGKSLIILGMALNCWSYLFMGPAPFLPWITNQLWNNILGSVLLGVGASMVIIPSMSVLQESVEMDGDEEYEDQVNEALSGVVNSALALGSSTGPIIMSGLVGSLGYAWASLVIAGLCGFSVFVLFVRCLLEFMWATRMSRRRSSLNRSRPTW
eukprot:TRINITY_DN8785_c0_g1_i3.p1 TRINITY_DN8785_c0_g1~~TRINITY_DN8785_c0_g1_i3.p1  ORF type:complete len:237 (+),score=59.28 TRINITY_DN8785_c0_g1_i3:52-762(+)